MRFYCGTSSIVGLIRAFDVVCSCTQGLLIVYIHSNGIAHTLLNTALTK